MTTDRGGTAWALTMLVVFAAEVATGAAFGFGGVLPHVAFWIFAALAGATAIELARAMSPAGDACDVALRAGVLAFAIVVAIGLLLGAARGVSVAAYATAQGVVFSGAFVLVRRRTGRSTGPPADAAVPATAALPAARWIAVWIAIWIAMVAFVIGMGVSHSPYTAYDAVSYHLFFPARWLQGHGLTIVPTPFSDEAQAYQPGNGELWFLWLMLPFHGDFLARIGQVPFYLLGAAATYLIAVRAGASRAHAIYAPTLFLAAPPVIEQAVGANVDLIAAATFVCGVYFALTAMESSARRDWAMWGIASGLFLGTKYLAAVYLPALVLVAVMRGPRARMLWGIPGIAALGLPWYLRNWIVAGSPLYPATLKVAGVTIGRGAYTHAAMLRSFMHTSNIRLLAVSLVHAFGATSFLVLGPLIAVTAALTIVRRRWWPAVGLFAALAAVVGLCWLTVGDNTDARFLLPAVALAPALPPLAFGRSRRGNAALHVCLAASMVWVLVGIDRQIELALPWFMADWLPLRGVIDSRFLWPFAAMVVLTVLVVEAVRRWDGGGGSDRPPHRRAARLAARLACAAGVVAILSGATLAVGAERWCRPGRCDYLRIASPHIRLSYLYGVRWLNEHVHGAHVAYAGINLPYPLAGSHLENTVSYVNTDNHLTWRFDQYAAAYRRGAFPAVGGVPLARPSGVLMPAVGEDAVRPRFERRAGDADEWTMNLRRQQIAVLFVSTLDPYEMEYTWHTADGFPIEDEWARRNPGAFTLVFSNEDVRIYEVAFK